MSTIHALRLTVSTALVAASRQWRRTCHNVLTAYGVSEACATPLLHTGRLGDGVRQVTLAAAVGIEGPSLVRLLDQLCAADLVRREDDPADGRAKTIWLTDAGRATNAKIEARLVELRASALKGVSKEDLEATLRVLRVFIASSEVTPG
ncbi:MAG: MarR family winged helix-turn-helix transcriptional regulator [Janthinobacterium lividum]